MLEGGYSIEGALPYVNVGIILAMAGLDYSHVREPDYDPDPSASPRDHEDIERKRRTILDLWKPRESLRQARHGASSRGATNIYYDTDGISEQQVETVRVCNDCGGSSSPSIPWRTREAGSMPSSSRAAAANHGRWRPQ